MRWDGQKREAGATDDVLPLSLPGLVRSVTTPEFAGVTFHEVRSRSALNKVPGASRMPFTWTINPYRGCSHACVYCFARRTHTYLDLDVGEDFDRQVVVNSSFLLVEGVLQNQDGVTSIKAERMSRLDGMPDEAAIDSHDFH